jgi:hypothetical protein
MIRSVRWRSLLLGIAIASAASATAVHSQSGVPPIPELERFIPRGQLKATVVLSTSRLTPGQLPAATLVLENAGRTTIRIPPAAHLGHGVVRRVFSMSGEELPAPVSCDAHRVVMPLAVRSLQELKPGQSAAMRLEESSCSAWPAMPTGDYRIHLTYRNYPDWPQNYDVYEEGGSETWDGEIEATPAPFTVIPFDDDVVRALMSSVENDGDADAIRLLGLGGTRAAVDPLLRRFARDAHSRETIITALALIEVPSSTAQLGEALEKLPFPERRPSAGTDPRMQQSLQRLLKRSQACDALPLVIAMMPPVSTARLLEERCVDLRVRLQALVDAPMPAPGIERARASERTAAAKRLLSELGRPPDVNNSARESRPQAMRTQPDAARLSNYVTTILFGRSYDASYYEAMAGVTRFGTTETFAPLRGALENESTRVRASRALAALTFQNDVGPVDLTAPGFWDRWWDQNRRRSREQWARDALSRRESPQLSLGWRPLSAKWGAAEYLVTVHRGRSQLVRELATHRFWSVRLGAAQGLVPFNRQLAGRLMLRELQNRYLGACTAAGGSLVELTGWWHPFQCHDLAERARVTTLWSRDVDLLPASPANTGR